MKASVEISMYPLTEDYKPMIIAFIEQLKKGGFRVEVNGMSTQIFGDFTEVMAVLTSAITKTWDDSKAIFILKIGKGELVSEKLPAGL